MEIKSNQIIKKNLIQSKINKRTPKEEKKVGKVRTDSTSLVSQKFLEDIKKTNVSDPNRVAEIKQSLKDGTYQVNFDEIANALID